jgi:hypothetical protein
MADPYDDAEPTAAAAPQPAFAQPVEAPIQDVDRAQGYLRQHEAAAQKYGANYEDIMKQRKEAISQVQSTLNQTIQEMRDKHEGKGPGQMNVPLAEFAAGMLSGVGPGAGNFAAQLGAGMKGAAGAVRTQRMQDSEFLKGVAELQAKSGEMGDVPLKDAAALAKAQQLRELQSQGALETGIVRAKLDRPQALGKDAMGNPVIFDPRANNGAGAILGANGKPLDIDNFGKTPDGKSLLGSNVHGDDFLKALPPDAPFSAETIKGYADYTHPLPTGSRTPATITYQNKLFDAVKQYDPDFDIKQYATIQKGMKDWTGNGTMAQRAVSAATIPGHMADLQGAAAALNNSGLLAGNKLANVLQTQTGDPRVQAFIAARQAVMTELPSFLGKGHPAEGQIMAWLNVLNESSSPAGMQAAIQGLSKVMHTQLETLSTAKSRDYGKPGKFSTDDLIGPENARAMADIVNNDIGTEGGALSAMRRSQNHTLAVGQKPPLPNPPSEVWERNAALLKKAPTPQNQKFFDDTFGPGSAKLVLSR